jgi:hypothetical protein
MECDFQSNKGFTRLEYRLEAVSVNCPTGTVLQYSLKKDIARPAKYR